MTEWALYKESRLALKVGFADFVVTQRTGQEKVKFLYCADSAVELFFRFPE